MQLQEVVPWGRSLDEYRGMFALSETDLRGRLLSCGDGPASFNAELTAVGKSQRLVSVDPLYVFAGPEIATRVEQTYQTIVLQVKLNHDRYVWSYFKDPDALGTARLNTMKIFLNDYQAGRAAGRYLVAALPELPFNNGEFDLCLCSHLLFLYSAQLSADFHLASMLEMLRVAREVRVFPLLDLDLQRSAHLDPVIAGLRSANFYAEIVDVPYIFQKGGGQMLRVVHNGQRIDEDPQPGKNRG
ncbi:MAG: SAM-dependent methyltransferase [Verrucomicrobia bacterium]|nr:SAM-dependent methyltransferase [Verrucomicrobiota bacterium]